MKNNKLLFIILALIVVVVSYLTRLHLYNRIPFPGETTDEYSNTWVGLSLLKIGFPVGISGLANGYPDTTYSYINVDRILQSTANGTPASINSPWFDHPVTVGLITGGYSYLKGASVFEDTSISLIRKPFVYIGVISAFLVFTLSWLLFGPLAASISGLIYSISPFVTVTSRLAQAENILIPFFLATLIFHYLFQKTGHIRFFWLAVIASGLSLLTKLSGISIIFAGLILILSGKGNLKHKVLNAFVYGLCSISFLLFYLVFGLAFDLSVFTQVLMGNTNRTYGIGPNAIQQLLTSSKVTNIRHFTDGWFLSGWLGFFALTFLRVKNVRFITVPLITYLAIYLFFGSNPFGWYAYPFIPFLFISLGVLLSRSIRHIRSIPFAVILLLIPIGVSINQMVDPAVFAGYVTHWRLGLVAVLFTSLLFQVSGLKQINKMLGLVLVIGLIGFALYISFRYFTSLTVDSWYHVG